MARQEAIEKWRTRAHSAEAELGVAIDMIRSLLNADRSYLEWNKDRRKAERLYK